MSSTNYPLVRRPIQLVCLTVLMHSNNKRTNYQLKNELTRPASRFTCSTPISVLPSAPSATPSDPEPFPISVADTAQSVLSKKTEMCINNVSVDIFSVAQNEGEDNFSRTAEAPARLRNFALCWKKHSLASTGFLEHLKTPTDGALSIQCLPSPSH